MTRARATDDTVAAVRRLASGRPKRAPVMVSPDRPAYRDHTGRRVDGMLRLHGLALSQVRQQVLRASAPEGVGTGEIVPAVVDVVTTDRVRVDLAR